MCVCVCLVGVKQLVLQIHCIWYGCVCDHKKTPKNHRNINAKPIIYNSLFDAVPGNEGLRNAKANFIHHICQISVCFVRFMCVIYENDLWFYPSSDFACKADADC